MGGGSVVGITTGYGLDGPGIESRWGARFSAPVQTGPGAHPALGTESFPGVKSGRGVTLTPHPLLVPWSRKSRAIPLLPLWAVGLYRASACTRVHFTVLLLRKYMEGSSPWPIVLHLPQEPSGGVNKPQQTSEKAMSKPRLEEETFCVPLTRKFRTSCI